VLLIQVRKSVDRVFDLSSFRLSVGLPTLKIGRKKFLDVSGQIADARSALFNEIRIQVQVDRSFRR
jgi:hypothetical protein